MATIPSTFSYYGKSRADFVDDLRTCPEMLRVYTAACHEIAINCWCSIYDSLGNVYAANEAVSSYAIPFTYQWHEIMSSNPEADIYEALNNLISLVETHYPMIA